MKNTISAALVATALSFGCGVHTAYAADETAVPTQDHLPGILDTVGFSGTLLVSKGGDILLHQAVNKSPQADAELITTDTPFIIASMSKSFTAALVLKLVDEGKLSLDDTLSSLLPDFDAPYAAKVTLRQMLQNRSGIPHYIDIPGWFDNDIKRTFTAESFMDTLKTLELKFEPGSDYLYSNVNYYLLARIIDRYAGMPYEDYLKTEILEPFGMRSTGQIYEAGTGTLAPNYLRGDDGSFEEIPVTNPALFRGTASMYSTAADLNAWGHAVLDGKVYSTAAAREAFNEATPMAWSVGKLPVSESRALDVHYYNGRLIGHLSLILLLPEVDGVVVVLNNNTAGYENMLKIGSKLAEQHFGGAE
ncbi:serine hydrolase domain-containing protein [Kordiimonas gwangyangensis]|uniref:serine hydrolase domain-containing protein n=1 Tax=Kordiimonas gwangyangensis TaxID=288022 RepID=UPI00037F93B4|nr:serine hydrolase domain-containing protein [Kordiimonas gwangyangensis]